MIHLKRGKRAILYKIQSMIAARARSRSLFEDATMPMWAGGSVIIIFKIQLYHLVVHSRHHSIRNDYGFYQIAQVLLVMGYVLQGRR